MLQMTKRSLVLPFYPALFLSLFFTVNYFFLNNYLLFSCQNYGNPLLWEYPETFNFVAISVSFKMYYYG